MYTGSETTRPAFPAAKALLLAGVILVCAVGALYFFLFDPTKVSFFPPCLFHQMTGWDCPGCGAQRALHELLHGHLVAAIRLNAMFIASLPLAAWFAPRWIRCGWKGEAIAFNPNWLWVFCGAWILFGILRNLPFPFFHWFAP